MTSPQPIPFKPHWPEPDPLYLSAPRLPPPPSYMESVLSAEWANWAKGAAEATSAPPDLSLIHL